MDCVYLPCYSCVSKMFCFLHITFLNILVYGWYNVLFESVISFWNVICYAKSLSTHLIIIGGIQVLGAGDQKYELLCSMRFSSQSLISSLKAL